MKKDKFIKIIKNTLSVILVLALFVIIYYQNRDRGLLGFGDNSSIPNQSKQTSISGFSNLSLGKTGENVAVLSPSALLIYDSDGNSQEIDIALSSPILYTKGDFAVCYDLNSFDAYVLKESKESYHIKTDNKIISAKVNRKGYLFVATEKDGYNCECLVYNNNSDLIFKWDISKNEFLDGDLNDDNNSIILSLASSEGNKLSGEIVQINITNAKVVKKYVFDSTLFFNVNFNSTNTYVALGNNSLKYFNSDGSEKWDYNYNGKKLLKADISNHNNMVLAFSGSGEMYDGNFTDVVVLNGLGEILGEKTYRGNAADISVGKNCVSIAIDKEIIIASSELEENKKITTDYSAKKTELFYNDNSVFVLSSSNGEILE